MLSSEMIPHSEGESVYRYFVRYYDFCITLSDIAQASILLAFGLHVNTRIMDSRSCEDEKTTRLDRRLTIYRVRTRLLGANRG